MSDVGDDVVAVPEVRGEHAVVSGEVGAWAWDQRGKPGNEVEGVEDDVSGPVTEGVLESVDDLSPFIDREAFVRQRRAGDVAAQAFEGVALVGMAHGAGMEGASRELSDAGGGRRRAGRDGVQGKRLASGVRADGDAVVDGGAEELLESVCGFEVEGGGLVVTEQQSLLLEGAGDAGGDGVEQALEFRLGRGGDTVEAGPFIFERVDAVDDEHVQWNWTNSMSCRGRPARSTMPLPSPVQVWAEVHEKYARPYPPVASTVMWARNRCRVPSSRFQASTPRQAPSSSMSRSSAMYSMKNSASCRRLC